MEKNIIKHSNRPTSEERKYGKPKFDIKLFINPAVEDWKLEYVFKKN